MKIINKDLLKQNIDLMVNEDLKANKILGANVFVWQNGIDIVDASYGYAKIDKSERLSNKYLFRIASMTKPITAVAILKEVEKGHISIYDSIDKYLPNFSEMFVACIENGKIVGKSKAKNKITILNLLTHTSGLGCGLTGEIIDNSISLLDNSSLSKSVDFYSKQLLEFEPLERLQYSPVVGFDILGRIVEIVSHKPFDEYLQNEIFVPLNMKNTSFNILEKQKNLIVDMHNIIDDKICKYDFLDNCVFGKIPTSHCCGGAGLLSSIVDYKNFAIMLACNGTFIGKRFLDEKIVKELSCPKVDDSVPKNYNWSLGFRVRVEHGIVPNGSFGWSGAYGTHFWIDSINNIVAIYMKNSMIDGGSSASTAQKFEEVVYKSLF